MLPLKHCCRLRATQRIAPLPSDGAAAVTSCWYNMVALVASRTFRTTDSEAVSERLRYDWVRGWAAGANHDSSGLRDQRRDRDVGPDHPAAA